MGHLGSAVVLWSLATGASGLAATFGILLSTRVFVGIGEGGYGPAAPTILADMFPLEMRGKIMSIFCAAIPVGSALGFVVGGQVGRTYWVGAGPSICLTPPGILLGLFFFWQRDPRLRKDEVIPAYEAAPG